MWYKDSTNCVFSSNGLKLSFVYDVLRRDEKNFYDFMHNNFLAYVSFKKV